MFPFTRKKKLQDQTLVPLSWKWRWLRRVRRLFSGTILVYLLILLIGLIPVNNDFEPAAEGIEVFISSNGVHADVIVPIQTEIINWRESFPEECFAGNTSGATYVAIGWGDKGFYVDTPRWADFKISIALKALFTPSPCCLHVVMKSKPTPDKNVRSVIISEQQYTKMVQAIQTCIQLDEKEKLILIPDASYHQFDAFYEASGNYHILNTCNSWVGWVMRKSGIKTPLLTPMPKTVFLYLPNSM